MELKNRVAVVTGGASGIGQAVVRRLSDGGAKVAIFDLNEAAGAEMVDELGADNTLFAPVNVVDETSVQAGLEKVIDTFGTVHINVNCAGVGNAAKTVGRDGAFPLDTWNFVIGVNLTGTFNVLRLCAEIMSRNEPVTEDGGRGVIINTASVAAYEGQIGQAAYSASKGGVVGLTLPVARDLSQFGIRVNTIVPGLINTPLFNGLTPSFVETLSQSVLYPKRLGRPDEIAQLAASIIDNDYINGECIRMDGGIRMQPR